MTKPNKGELRLDLNTPEGRYAARAFAFFIMPLSEEEYALAKAILDLVGREG